MNETLFRTALLSTLAIGCVPDFGTGNVELALLGVASSTVAACEFEDGLPPVLGNALVLDLAASDTLRLPIVLRNESDDPISAKDMDMRWDCNAMGFSDGGIGALRVPVFDPKVPFCNDTRRATTDFIGFDVIAVTGAPVLPGETGVVWAEVVSATLGRGIREAIDLGILADRCYTFAQSDQNHPDCQAFEAAFEQAGGGPVDEGVLLTYFGFARMDGTYRLGDDPMPPPLASGYQMQLRGMVRAENAAEDSVFSNEVIQLVEFCRNCGVLTGGVPPSRDPRQGFECYYD